MRIESFRADLFRIPLPATLSDSTHGEIPYFELITVRLEADTGLEGSGYTYTVGHGGAAIRALLDADLAPLLRGADPEPIEELWDRMWWRLHWVGRGGVAAFAMSAVDIALWDLRGKHLGQPLWKLLGGHSPRVKAYAGGVDLYLTPEQLAAQTSAFLEAGFRAIKMKVGRERLSEDLERVALVRRLLGPAMPLMVDANMRWTVEQAIEASRALADYGVFWLEEPVIPEDVEGHVRVACEGPLPVAAGENLHTVYEFERLITAGGVSFPEPDISNMGGVTAWMRVAHFAAAQRLPVTTHGVHDLHVHLLAAVPNASYLEIHGFGLERFLRHPLRFEDGEAIAPDRPGHGVEFRSDALAPCLVGPSGV